VNSFPLIPRLLGQQPGETAESFGLRAFAYLVTERVPVTLLTPEQQAAALHFSLVAVTAPDVADAVRARYHDVRLQLVAAASRPVVVDAPPAAPAARQASSLPGGDKVARPVPPTRPTPPSAAVSVVSGNPLPDAATVAARLAAARRLSLHRGMTNANTDGDAL
jgi:hypothetical protein